MPRRARFERERLPDALHYYSEREGMRLFGRGTWRSARCVFHDDDRPSLSVNIATGRYKCFACGERGDLLDFHQRRHRLTFAEAARDLGAMR